MAKGGKGKYSGIKAGEAFVELFANDDRLMASFDRIKKRLMGLGGALKTIGFRLGAIGTGFTAAMLATLPAAARVEASMIRLRLLFGENAKEAEAFVQSFARGTRRAGIFIRESLNSFQAFFQGLQFTTDEAFELSRALVQLQTDFAAGAGQATGESLRRFIAALAGSPEVLDQFGIDLKEASLSAELLAYGIDSVRQATEKQKTIARLSLIFDRLGRQGSIGAALKTVESFTVGLDFMKGAFIEVASTIAFSFKPVFDQLVQGLVVASELTQKFVNENQALVRQLLLVGPVLTAAGAGLVALGLGLQILGLAFGGFALLLKLPMAMARMAIKAVGLLSTFGKLFGIFGQIGSLIPAVLFLVLLFKNWRMVLADLVDIMQTRFLGLFSKIRSEARTLASMLKESLDVLLLAVTTGQLERAMQLASIELELIWMQTVASMKKIWDEFVNGVTGSFSDLFALVLRPGEWIDRRFNRTASEIGNKVVGDAIRAAFGIPNESIQDLIKQRKELIDAIKENAEGRGAFDYLKNLRGRLAELMQGTLGDIGDGLRQNVQTGLQETLFGLTGGGSVQKNIEKNTEATARYTKELAGRPGPVFGG